MAAALLAGAGPDVVDSGTATTFDVISATGDYVGGVILLEWARPMRSASHTAKPLRVELAWPEWTVGRTTVESIQSGLFHGHVGAIRHILRQLTAEIFLSPSSLRFWDGRNFPLV